MELDIKAMALHVAKAMLAQATDDAEAWDGLTADEQGEFILSAMTACAAHDAFLTAAGYRSVPPGALTAPQHPNEAKAMIKAGREYMLAHGRKKGLLEAPKPKLILPGRPH